MNNRAVQGTYDDDMLRELLQGIDYTNAGFDDTDMQLLGLGDFGDYDMGDMFGDDGGDATDGNDADEPGEPTENIRNRLRPFPHRSGSRHP